MSCIDPIADMLLRIRNAQGAGLEKVELQSSKVKTEIAKILKREGYILDYAVEGGIKKTLVLYIKYVNGKPAIMGLRRRSKLGLRVYTRFDKIPKVLGGMGISILSTSGGMLTDKEARKQKLGGEIICVVW